VVPILATFLLLVGAVVAVFAAVWWALGPGDPTQPMLEAGRTFVEAAAVVGMLVLAYLLFFPLARVLLAPFAEKISERVETRVLGSVGGAGDGGAVRAVVEAAKMLAFQASVALPLLLLLFVPVAGEVLLFVAGAFLTGIGALDVAMSRKRMRLGEKLSFARRNAGLTLGLGIAIYLVLLVPVLNLLALPLGAVAATLAFLRASGKDRGPVPFR